MLVDYETIPPELQEDIAYSIQEFMGEDYDEIKVGLENGSKIPMVEVDPAKIAFRPWKISKKAVETYVRLYKSGSDFPPIVIARGKLLEGGHRLRAALAMKVKRVWAFDLTGVKVVKSQDGLEIYKFGR